MPESRDRALSLLQENQLLEVTKLSSLPIAFNILNFKRGRDDKQGSFALVSEQDICLRGRPSLLPLKPKIVFIVCHMQGLVT